MHTDFSAVHDVVWTYLDGLYEGDVARLERAFAPEACLYASLDGKSDALPFAQWLERVRDRKSAKASGHPSTNRIISIDIEGSMALAKATSSFPPRRFLDYLSLIKIGAEWKIIAKIYHIEDL